MKHKIILSSIVATLLVSPLNALNMLERFEAMEKEMEALKSEIKLLKSNQRNTIENVKDSNDDIDDEEDVDDIDDDEDTLDSDEESDDDEESEEIDIEEELEEIKENLSDLNKATSGSHLKFDVDYRFAADNLQYKMADGSKAKNDALLTNRLWINMDWTATDNLSFHGQLGYYKAFGNRSGASTDNQLENFDWITNENAYDGTLRVRSAYFYYTNRNFLDTGIPWTFSVGRRHSTNGLPINLREDDAKRSPLSHTINVEFDGLSTKLDLRKWVKGMKFQVCAGRGLSNANTMFSTSGAPYATNNGDIPDVDLLGIIFTGYNNGQYLFKTQYYYAHNLIDLNTPGVYTNGFKTVGNLHSGAALFMVNGIGNGISDYLDETRVFASAAMSKTDPKANQGMLGSTQSKTGYSYWLGAQLPSLFTEDGRMGIEYNHGSKYWRNITYGEDTIIGSKVAARGNAYELYFTEYFVEDILSMQLRYTYIDYDYSGSNGFFGNTTGTPVKISSGMAGGSQIVDEAQDIRLYIRYKY